MMPNRHPPLFEVYRTRFFGHTFELDRDRHSPIETMRLLRRQVRAAKAAGKALLGLSERRRFGCCFRDTSMSSPLRLYRPTIGPSHLAFDPSPYVFSRD